MLCDADRLAFSEVEAKLAEYMANGDWFSSEDILWLTGQNEGMRRLRALRKRYVVEKRRVSGRLWQYRLVQPGKES